jgi:predicted dehydrogenase
MHRITEVEVPTTARHVGLHHGSSYLEHVDFARAIREGRPPSVTLLDGLWSVAVGVAAHRSIETGAPVHLADLEELAGLGAPAGAGTVT